MTTPKKPAAQTEAEGADTMQVVYKDVTYTFGADPDDLDGAIIEALDDQKLSHALKAMLSDDDWLKFKATKPRVRDYAGLIDAWATAAGHGTAGE